jgi:hypothetical protein
MNFFRYFRHRVLPPLTLGDQVRAEAIRRGRGWESVADECASLAEEWFGKAPCYGRDLAIVFGEAFRTE